MVPPRGGETAEPKNMCDAEEFDRFRRQRNIFAAAAIIMILATMVVVLPAFVSWQRQLNAANGDLLDLQRQIISVQRRIHETQASILRSQYELSALRRRR